MKISLHCGGSLKSSNFLSLPGVGWVCDGKVMGIRTLNTTGKFIHFLIIVGGFLTVDFKFKNLCSYYYTLIMYKTESRHVRHNSEETDKV